MFEVKITPARQRVSKNKVSSGSVLGVAYNALSDHYCVEYTSSSSGRIEVISFFKENGIFKAHHRCPAEKSGYSRGCWHLGLFPWVYGLEEKDYLIEVYDKFPTVRATIDLSEHYLGRKGNFVLIQVETTEEDPPAPEPAPTIVPTINLTDEDKFLAELLPVELIEKVVPFRQRQRKRLTDGQKSRIPKGVKYIPQGNEVHYAVASMLYEEWAPPLLIGPAGSGKSTLTELVAQIMHLPLRRISGGIDVNAEYLLGSKTLAPNEEVNKSLVAKVALASTKAGSPLTPEEFAEVQSKLQSSTMQVVHEPGILLQAIKDGEMILVDEVNMLIPEVTSILHSLLDWQKTITVSGVGEVKAHEDFRLISAMNVGYMGTRPLNKAFRDRFRGIQVNPMDEETLNTVLLEKVDNNTAEKLSKIYFTLYENAYSPMGATLSESCISLRAVLRAAEEYSMGVGVLKEITISCLTESIESEQERTQVKDLIEMNF